MFLFTRLNMMLLFCSISMLGNESINALSLTMHSGGVQRLSYEEQMARAKRESEQSKANEERMRRWRSTQLEAAGRGLIGDLGSAPMARVHQSALKRSEEDQGGAGPSQCVPIKESESLIFQQNNAQFCARGSGSAGQCHQLKKMGPRRDDKNPQMEQFCEWIGEEGNAFLQLSLTKAPAPRSRQEEEAQLQAALAASRGGAVAQEQGRGAQALAGGRAVDSQCIAIPHQDQGLFWTEPLYAKCAREGASNQATCENVGRIVQIRGQEPIIRDEVFCMWID